MHSVHPCLIVFDGKDSWAENCSSQLILIKKMFIASGIGERLREERDRLGMNQTDFGQSAGVSRGTQKAYELESSSPDIRYLTVLQGLGVDVLYVLTGGRGSVDGNSLSAAETDLLEHYRQLPEIDQTHTNRMVSALAEAVGRHNVKGDN